MDISIRRKGLRKPSYILTQHLKLMEQTKSQFGGVVYECVRCGTKVTAEELASLPEIKCICGYRVLKKARPPVVKQLKAL
jgi:DNA-directed RNA polymerase subunit P